MKEESEAPAAGPALHNECLWKPGDVLPCPHPMCPNGVPGFYLIVPDIQTTMVRRYRREVLSAEEVAEPWFTWTEEDEYLRRYPWASTASAPSGAPKSVSERSGGASLKGK